VATFGEDGSIRWWTTKVGRNPLDSVAVHGLRWSPDSQRVVGIWEGLRSWDPASGSSTLEASAPEGEVSPDGSLIAVEDLDTISLYDVATATAGPRVVAAPGVGGFISRVAWSGDGSKLATEATHDATYENPEPGRIRVWAVGTGGALTETASLPIEDTDFDLIAFAPDGSMIVLSDATGLSTWDLRGEPVHVLDLEDAYEVAFAPDGRLAAFRDGDTTRIVDSTTWTTQFTLPRGEFAWSPDGSVIAVVDTRLGLYDTVTGEQLGDLIELSGWGVDTIVWSPDGSRLAASGGLDPEVLQVVDSWGESQACALLADVFGDDLAGLIGDDRTSVCVGPVTERASRLPADVRRYTTAQYGGVLSEA
jgi:WD40 repeat protein